MSLNVQILEESFALIKPYGVEFASRFYSILFQDNPEVKPLFANTNMVDQEKKLVQTLVLVVWNLRNLTYLSTILRDLGERHVRYGTLQAHYPVVGVALLKTLEFYLGSNWTPEVKQAWIDAYGAIVNIMLEGAKRSEEMIAVEDVKPPTTKPIIVDFDSKPLPETIADQDNSTEITELRNVPRWTTSPIPSNSTPRSPLINASKFELKLTLILFMLASTFTVGVGILYYNSHLIKEPQEVTTPKENIAH